MLRTWNQFIVWVAEGFGVGRVPVSPGTFGSLLGVGWMLLLVKTGSLAGYGVGLVAGVGISVAVCGAAERITGRKDPGSVVLDEIVAVPICYLPWVMMSSRKGQALPAVESFFSEKTWWWTLVLFGLFRLFDIWKPWPIGPSQKLPGGWGVTVDDVLAAGLVAALSCFWVG